MQKALFQMCIFGANFHQHDVGTFRRYHFGLINRNTITFTQFVQIWKSLPPRGKKIENHPNRIVSNFFFCRSPRTYLICQSLFRHCCVSSRSHSTVVYVLNSIITNNDMFCAHTCLSKFMKKKNPLVFG